jgi:hypothetical protein
MKNSEQKENKKVKERQIKKYKALIDEKRKREAMLNERLKDQEKMRKEKIKNEVIDLTKNGIDDDVKKYLALGPDFSEAPTRVPYERIISEREKMCSVIEKEGELKEID